MRPLSAIAALTLLAACAPAPTSHAADAVTVTTARAERRAFAATDELSGTLVASRAVTVGANAAGRLSAVPVRVGDHVEAGETIATIDASAYAAALAQASGARAAAAAAVNQAQAALIAAQARERLAAATAQRDAELYRSGDVSRQHYDESAAGLQTARAAVVQAQASIASAAGSAAQSQASIEVASVPLRDTVIRAPFAGIVTQTFADAGAVVNPGSPIVAMEDDRSLEAEVAVPESLAATMHPGAPVMLHVDALNTDVAGRVRAVIPSANAQLHTATVRVAVTPHEGLLRGMFARLRVRSASGAQIAVPWQAVVTRAGQSGVFEVKDGRASFVPVETGASTNGWIAVRGIAAGTAVAMTGLELLDDGSAVALR